MNDPTILQSLNDLASKLSAGSIPGGVTGAAYTDPGREELIVRYCTGIGSFKKSGNTQFIKIQCTMYKPSGTEDGHHEGIAQLVVDISEAFNRPPTPDPPFDEPKGPMVYFPVASHSQGTWTFEDGSTISAVGPANLHAIGYIDTASQLWVSANQLITGSTGRYLGAQGLKTMGGSFWVAKEKKLTSTDPFKVRTLEVFRVVRKDFIASAGPQ